jgi:xanthine dehydrogenase YagS FAD-binding subunit
VEAALKGKPASEKLFADAARLAFENAIAYAHNGYKIPLGQQAIVRNLVDLTDLTTA